jgi:hypothetical protein
MPNTHDDLGLSDEELEALEDEDEHVEPETEDEDEPEAETPERDATAAAELEPQAAKPETKDFVPQWQPDPVEDYDTKMAEIAERKKALRAQYQDGDLDLDSYEEARDAVDQQALALREAALKTQIASEQAEQTRMQRWQWEIERFMSEESNAAFRADAPDSRNAQLDAAVKALAQMPEHAGKPDRFFLEEGARWVRALHGEVAPTQTAAPAKPKAKPRIPPNLGDLPSADVADVGGDEFAKYDKLEGMDVEAALAKMSPAEAERYLRGH